MAINQNHTFEELDGVKCAIVEKCVTPERSWFLKELLAFNGYTVVMVPTPAPKAVAKSAAASSEEKITEPSAPETFTVGVTDATFNPINAVYGRQLHTQDGHVVTPAYWQQKETISHDEIPYYQIRRK
jgi:hypothetical protein